MKRFLRNKYFLLFVALLFVALLFLGQSLIKKNQTNIAIQKPDDSIFLAPGKQWTSPKKVEDYFVENLHMTLDEAKNVRTKEGSDGKISLRLRESTTFEALLSNLEYYGFVKNKEALRYALEKTVDMVPGHANPLLVGNNTIDVWASYRISEDMSTWEIADQLLNNPTYFSFDDYNKTFVP